MNQIIGTLIFSSPVFIAVALMCFSVYLLNMWRWFLKRGRKSPLVNKKLWRGPGESLRKKIEDLDLDLMGMLFAIPFSFLALLPWYAAHIYKFSKGTGDWGSVAILVGGNVVMILFCLWRAGRIWQERNHNILGLDGELYVGRHLNHLMLKGCRVYHDFPVENFNIDHIVVGQSGIFAIETKGRSKFDTGNATKDAKMICDGDKLQYPNGSWETEPLQQARNNAIWLQNWLRSRSSSGKEQIVVEPVVALPGWYVELKSNKMKVYNGKIVDDHGQFDPSKSHFLASGKKIIDENLVSSVVHMLEERCRDVQPVAYMKPSNQA